MGASNAACCKWQGRVRLLLAASLLSAYAAHAHLMSAGVGAVQVRAQDAVVLIGVPVAVFEGVDDDGDGLLQPGEIRAHRKEILAQLESSFYLAVGGKAARVKEAHLLVSVHAEDGVSTPQLEWWALLDFDPPSLATACTEIALRWFAGARLSAQEMTYTVQVQRAGEVQTAVFSKVHMLHTFGCTADSAIGAH
jgi:hypothetical protein